MFELNLKDIPTVKDIIEPPIETKICTQCGYPKNIESFGWRYCYEQRLEICKSCRNRNAKIANEKERFIKFNAVTKMSWKKNANT